MATENVADWLPRDTMIDPVTQPVSHDMNLQEFIPDAGTFISLRHDLPSHLCWGTSEIWASEHQVLPMPSLYGFDVDTNVRALPRVRYPWGEVTDIPTSSRQLLDTSRDNFFLVYFMICTTSERGCTSGSLDRTGGECLMMFYTICCPPGLSGWSRTLRLHREDRLSLTTWPLLYPVPTLSLCRLSFWSIVPQPSEFNPFAEVEEVDRDQGDAPAQSAQGMLKTHLVSLYQMTSRNCTHVSIADYNQVSQLYEAACLKLAIARLSDEHISLTWRLQWAKIGDFSMTSVLVTELASRPVILEEIGESGSDNSEEMTSYIEKTKEFGE
ncbi:hypothetical protein JCGZ_10828 [Jatropha curcas]|uniref:Aminotransferase-like plant mobile domain-containing protein n=1 Tax=Jatropha curcas TaxID=180498 RepID=A0A067KT41_JATCU|nr:hypothetical protein JCGZ_10828 [Jatropha curcas]